MRLLHLIILYALNLSLVLGWYFALKPEPDNDHSIIVYTFFVLYIDYVSFKDTIDNILFMDV